MRRSYRTFVKYARPALLVVLVLSAITSGFLVLLYQASQYEPEFYVQALSVNHSDYEEAGDNLEQSVLELHNAAQREGHWQAVFTEEQVNGWLASDLPEKFPHVLPRGVVEPRVAIEADYLQVACRYDNGKVDTVVSFALDVDLTSEVNTLAIRVCRVRAGSLPVPLKRFLDRITAAGHKADIPLRWSQTDGDPVALVTVPHEHEDYAHREIYVDQVQLRDGELFLAGRTEKATQQKVAESTTPAPESTKRTSVAHARRQAPKSRLVVAR